VDRARAELARDLDPDVVRADVEVDRRVAERADGRVDRNARVAEVRTIVAKLAPEDQMLLILRLNRRLGWNEVARVLDGEGDEQALARRAAALRKRFERLKETLRAELS
jgi:RNA polymerase sigma-70 factor (ECF subfamily)